MIVIRGVLGKKKSVVFFGRIIVLATIARMIFGWMLS